MTRPLKNILYCHCAYAKVVPNDVKQGLLERLTDSGVAFDAVADLCEMSANKDAVLQQLAQQNGLQIAACYPRAVKWLFAAAGAPLKEGQYDVHNMRCDSAEEIEQAMFADRAQTTEESNP